MGAIRFNQGVPYYIDSTGAAKRINFWTVAQFSYDPSNLTAGTQQVFTWSFPGVVLGNPVIPSFSLDLQGLQLTAYVQSAGIVSTVLRNGTTGAINLAPGTLTLMVATFVP